MIGHWICRLAPWPVYLTAVLSGAVLLASGAGAQVELRVWPAMTKGPAGAPVTIVEFSDYQ